MTLSRAHTMVRMSRESLAVQFVLAMRAQMERKKKAEGKKK